LFSSSKKEKHFRTLISSNPILDICYDIIKGGIYNFSGCLGSHKTSTLFNIMQNYNQYSGHVGLYLNCASHAETIRAMESAGCWGFSNGQLTKQQTDAGVFMLAAKTIYVARQLR